MSKENILSRDNEKYLADKKIYRRGQSNASLARISEIKKTRESYHGDRCSVSVVLNIFMFAYVAPFIIF